MMTKMEKVYFILLVLVNKNIPSSFLNDNFLLCCETRLKKNKVYLNIRKVRFEIQEDLIQMFSKNTETVITGINLQNCFFYQNLNFL